MEILYVLLFIAGIIYAAITVFLGDMFGFRFRFGGRGLPLLSPGMLGTFATVFGGCGYALTANTPRSELFIALVSFVSALIAAGTIFAFRSVPAKKAERNAAAAARQMIGKTAEVVTLIMNGAKGEIEYEQGGVRLSAPARIAAGSVVKQGDFVRIVDVVSGTFVVEKFESESEKVSWM